MGVVLADLDCGLAIAKVNRRCVWCGHDGGRETAIICIAIQTYTLLPQILNENYCI